MGLIADLAALRVHVLVVGVPGRPLLRVQGEAAVRARGWVLADSPADTDVLLVCGDATGELGDAVDGVWAQVPVPRARRIVRSAAGFGDALDSAARVLGNAALQREAARARGDAATAGSAPAPAHDVHVDPHVHGSPHAHHDEHEHDMPHHGHDAMSMEGPGGIPLAPGWDGDRDGLEMDVLHLRLGPVLPDWPAGLIVDATLSGDVVVAAEARLLDPQPDRSDIDADRAAFVLACDRSAATLRLAGWGALARRLDRAADDVLGGAEPAGRLREIRVVAQRVARSSVLRWGLADERVRARLLVILGDAERAAFAEPPVDAPLDPAALARELPGRGLADVRLAVSVAGGEPIRAAIDD